MAKGIGPLFGVEIDGERKNLFGSLATAKELQAAVVAQGGKAVIFEHSDAEIKARDAEAAEDWFFDLAMQYYIAARVSAVLVGLMPVCGNLYHHAVELFLKAGLSRKYSMRDLANRHKFGHCLPKIWAAFKADFASPALRQFDDHYAPEMGRNSVSRQGLAGGGTDGRRVGGRHFLHRAVVPAKVRSKW
jgi:hypothetical protein